MLFCGLHGVGQKVLQNLVNEVYFVDKEQYMKEMNLFITGNMSRVHTFFDQIIEGCADADSSSLEAARPEDFMPRDILYDIQMHQFLAHRAQKIVLSITEELKSYSSATSKSTNTGMFQASNRIIPLQQVESQTIRSLFNLIGHCNVNWIINSADSIEDDAHPFCFFAGRDGATRVSYLPSSIKGPDPKECQ